MDQQMNISVAWGTLWRIFFMGLLVLVLYIALDIFLALFLAIVISSALHPLVTWLENHHIPRILGTLAIYIFVTFFIALIIYTVVPIALAEFATLLEGTQYLPSVVTDFLNQSNIIAQLQENITSIANSLFSGTSSLLEIASNFFGGVALAISVFILSFYLTVGKDGVERFLRAVLPHEYENIAMTLYDRIRRKLGRWLEGQIFLSVVVGTVVFLGLWFLGVKYSLLLGILAGILELVPVVGPIFSGALAIVIGLTQSFGLGVSILVLFIIVQQLENNFLIPLVNRFTTALDPVTVIIALLVGVKVLGFAGLILAVPVAVLIQEVVENWNEIRNKKRSLGL